MTKFTAKKVILKDNNGKYLVPYTGEGGGLPVGTIFSMPATSTYTPENALATDGAEYTKTQFENLYTDWLVGGRLETCTYEEYQTDVTTNGACAKFGLDTVNEKFKVPLIPNGYYIKAGNCTANKAGLPNIEHYHIQGGDSGAPAGRYGSTVTDKPGGTYDTSGYASNGTRGYNTSGVQGNINPIYGKSDTVETNAVAYRYFVVVATGSINQSQMDWSQWASNLSGKMNKDHSNDTKPYLKTSYVNSTSGYNIWSNGYCEQWGVVSVHSDKEINVALLKAMKDTNYRCLGTLKSSFTVTTDAGIGIIPINTNTITVRCGAGGGKGDFNVQWSISGYLAEGEY